MAKQEHYEIKRRYEFTEAWRGVTTPMRALALEGERKTLGQIISGEGSFWTDEGRPRYNFCNKKIHPHLHCADGAKLSVQASDRHRCEPENDEGPYTSLEVACFSVPPPESWEIYNMGEDTLRTGAIYGRVPADLVRAFVDEHGGEA